MRSLCSHQIANDRNEFADFRVPFYAENFSWEICGPDPELLATRLPLTKHHPLTNSKRKVTDHITYRSWDAVNFWTLLRGPKAPQPSPQVRH